MTKLKFSLPPPSWPQSALAPGLAQARGHHHHRHHHHYHHHCCALPYPISYLHNYGPGLVPGTFAYYDGPSTNRLRAECGGLSRPGSPPASLQLIHPESLSTSPSGRPALALAGQV